MRLFRKNSHVYVAMKKKITYKKKEGVNDRLRPKLLQQDTNGKHTSVPNTKTERNIEQFKHIVHPIPKENQGTSLVESQIWLGRKTSYGLEYTTID